MKRLAVLLISFFLLASNAYAEKKDATLVKCESADEYILKVSGEYLRVKLLNFSRKDTILNKTIDEYTCNKVKNKKLEIEYSNEEKDKYNRILVDLFVDDKNIQEELISMGYGMVSNVSKEYPNLAYLCELEKDAIINKLGIWSYIESEDFCKNDIKNEVTENNKKDKNNKINKIDSSINIILIIVTISIILLIILYFIKKRG